MQNVENTIKKSVTQGANLVRGSATLGANVVRAGARGSVVVAKGTVTGVARGVTTATSTVTNTVTSTVASSAKSMRRGGHMIFRSMSRSDSDNSENDDEYSDNPSETGGGGGGGPGGNDKPRRRSRRNNNRHRSGDASIPNKDRPSYRTSGGGALSYNPDNVSEAADDEDESENTSIFSGGNMSGQQQLPHSLLKAKHISESAGTHRLQRILKQSGVVLDGEMEHTNEGGGDYLYYQDPVDLVLEHRAAIRNNRRSKANTITERIPDAKNVAQVSRFCSRVVLPPFKVDLVSLGGEHVLTSGYPDETMQQEVMLCMRCQEFEISTGNENVLLSSLQYPQEYAKHKRSLGLFLSTSSTTTSAAMTTSHYSFTASAGKSHKLQYILIARSTTKPVLDPPIRKKRLNQSNNAKLAKQQQQREESERGGDYDTMFGGQGDESFLDESLMSMSMDASSEGGGRGGKQSQQQHDKQQQQQKQQVIRTPTSVDLDDTERHQHSDHDEPHVEGEEESVMLEGDEEGEEEDLPEIASFPVLVCMLLNADGTAPDIRKLIPLINLTTIQDLHATVVQLAFDNGDTIRVDFGNDSIAGLDKEKFIWSLLQIHAVLCLSVLERNPHAAARNMLSPVNVRNLDRAELQYIATVNKFLSKSPLLCALLDRQRALDNDNDHVGDKDKPQGQEGTTTTTKSSSKESEERDNLAYDLIMGNISLRVTLYSEEERKDAEEILNSIPWDDDGNNTEAGGVAERLGLMLHMRMRDLEAETCRRLIAWEDEKHFSASHAPKLFTSSDARDTVDALALASLFKTLESLDTELQAMEEWLQERAGAIKPLTDDCADIEEENRQLEQQWKSYDMLGSEMKRLLMGMEIPDSVLRTLRNPASALVYDEDGRVDVDESEAGVDDIYQAGRALQDAMEFPRLSGGLHLDAVIERAEGLNTVATSFCTALAHIIVTVMEQFNEEVLAGSDHGKVSKNDTHAMIAKKIRDTQRKFQSALLGYIKLIEILSALSPDMLPALRDAYSEMVAESILMKKRMKGYFQALPGKNAAYMSKAGKDLKDYIAFSDDEVLDLVSAQDMRAALSELLPVIAREAYFTSALFGAATKEQDGREKKRNFESTRKAVDHASQHFRYYIERTCGIVPDNIGGKSTIEGGVKGDPLLCLVGSIYLNEAMDNYVDREKKGGDHSLSLAYVRATILELRKKADKQWVGWVEKQIEWIRTHDGVPLTGKRAGVFPSFARFPCYLDHLMLACSEGREESYVPDIIHIKVINYYLQKLAATLLESLKECSARETTDQQYAANVMQMENTYFFTQSIKQRHEIFAELFAKQMTKANAICKESTDAYLGWMIKREFTTLHELFSKVSKLRKEIGDKQVPTQIPKAQFVRTLQKEANRDVMKDKIGTMYSRMEKHLSEEGTLLPIAWKALVKVLYEWFGRWEKLSTQLYGHTLNPSAVDIVRIAKAAGGDAKPKQGSSSDFGFKSILALGNKASP